MELFFAFCAVVLLVDEQRLMLKIHAVPRQTQKLALPQSGKRIDEQLDLIRKNFVYFSKNIPRGSFTIKKCFDRIKAQFIHSQSSNAKTVSRYLGEEVA